MKPSKKTTRTNVVTPAAPAASLPAAKPAAAAIQKPKTPVAEAKAPAAPAAQPAKKTVTTVKAKVDVGFGNTLYIRGQGCGLSWEKGLPLVCLDASSWVWSTEKANETIAFKLLVNDRVWAQGEDLVAPPGAQVEAAPVF